jgi:hypothetical protein
MGPASMEESPIRLAGWKGRSGGARSGAELGPGSKKELCEVVRVLLSVRSANVLIVGR